jgi:2,4-dienoyl-CoA reductase-like NADH-dependent reductase (Old Yellow Enzyme family)
MTVLFTPIKVGEMTVKNRFVRSATNEGLADSVGFVPGSLGEMYRRLAEGEVGMIITGYAYVSPEGKGSPRQGSIADDRYIRNWQAVVSVARQRDVRLIMQIVHAGRQTTPDIIGTYPMAPSAVADPTTGIIPRAMNHAQIEHEIRAFGAAARRAREAGFDGIQLHIAHGFLLSEFISPRTNTRYDQWGASTENRRRFVIEVVRQCRIDAGPDYPILAKLNSEDGVAGGLTLAESIAHAKALSEFGVCAIEVSGGTAEAGPFASRKVVRQSDEGYFLEAAAQIKKNVKVPVIAVGGFRSLSVMAEAVESGKCDMIALSRPLIREPDLVHKFKEGRSEQAECISCDECESPEGIRCAKLVS